MVIIETPVFTKIICNALPDESYCKLQEALIKNPDSGKVIKGSGGVRKIRWSVPDKGKRGGIRVIYYWLTDEEQIYMLYAYSKLKQEDLTPTQINILKNVVAEELLYG